MKHLLLAMAACFILHSASAKRTKKAPEHAWGNVIDWIDLETAYRVGKERGIPIMLIIWRTGCPACESLKKSFPSNKELIFASRHLSMVEAEVPKHPFTKSEKFDVDGQYVPRIFFMDPSGTVINEFYNKGGNAKFKYYHPDDSKLLDIMWALVKEYSRVTHAEF